MTDNYWVDLGIKVVLFLVASYFIFYKSWLKALGIEIAKLSTKEQLTKLEEEVKKDFNEKLESYKTKLSEELALKIEPIKSDLAKNNITHQIQFSHLHKERSKVIVEIYRNLQELHSAMVNWTAPMQPVFEDAKEESKQRTIRVNTAMDNFRNHYIVNKIFLTKKFCTDIDSLFQVYWDKGYDYGYIKARVLSGEISGDYYKQFSKEMSDISKLVRNELPKKMEELEKKFRIILKVENEK